MAKWPLFLLAFALPSAADISPEAKIYLDKALDIIQEKSVKRETNWAEMRTKAYAAAGNAAKPADTYEAIRVALRFVNDHHSSLFTPEQVKMLGKGQRRGLGFLPVSGYVLRVTPKGPADMAGLRLGMRIKSVNGKGFENDEEM